MTARKCHHLKAEHAFFLGGLLLGLCAILASGCRSDCGEENCSPPMDVESGKYKVGREVRSFEETATPAHLPDLTAATVEIDAENRKVILTYTDLMGESVRISFNERPDGGGA